MGSTKGGWRVGGSWWGWLVGAVGGFGSGWVGQVSVFRAQRREVHFSAEAAGHWTRGRCSCCISCISSGRSSGKLGSTLGNSGPRGSSAVCEPNQSTVRPSQSGFGTKGLSFFFLSAINSFGAKPAVRNEASVCSHAVGSDSHLPSSSSSSSII